MISKCAAWCDETDQSQAVLGAETERGGDRYGEGIFGPSITVAHIHTYHYRGQDDAPDGLIMADGLTGLLHARFLASSKRSYMHSIRSASAFRAFR